jgi:transposase
MPMIELINTYNSEHLEQLCLQATDIRSLQRLQAIYLRGQGKTPPEIARILGRCPKTVRNWIKRFNIGGPDALKYTHTGGRTAKLTSQQEEALIRSIKEARPDGRRWTLKTLAEKVFEEYGVRLSQQQIYERVKRHNLSQFLSKSLLNQSSKTVGISPTEGRNKGERELF